MSMPSVGGSNSAVGVVTDGSFAPIGVNGTNDAGMCRVIPRARVAWMHCSTNVLGVNPCWHAIDLTFAITSFESVYATLGIDHLVVYKCVIMMPKLYETVKLSTRNYLTT